MVDRGAALILEGAAGGRGGARGGIYPGSSIGAGPVMARRGKGTVAAGNSRLDIDGRIEPYAAPSRTRAPGVRPLGRNGVTPFIHEAGQLRGQGFAPPGG